MSGIAGMEGVKMIKATDEFLKQMDESFEVRKQEIFAAEDALVIAGTVYYVSNNGNDKNDGRSPETAWRTLQRVSDAALFPGDGVLFKRGDLFRGGVNAREGVSYGAYGAGEKPKIYGWDEDLADAAMWEEIDSVHHIWKYKKLILDPGTLVFNSGEAHSRKLIPSYRNLQFVCRDDESKLFVMADEMTKDLDIFWRYDLLLSRQKSKGEDFPVPVAGRDAEIHSGELYLRCDKGNPGKVFDSIESVAARCCFTVGSKANVKIDNICMKYACFGVSAGGASVVGLTVTNCEIGWVGGNIQHYAGTDPNYPQGTHGSVTRYGNAIEVYGGCEDYTVANCYIYESYDAGITHQVNTSVKRVMKGVHYTGNLIEKCVYGIEYFLDQRNGEAESYMEDIEMSDNFIRLSGYGWGQQRHNVDTPALIKGWSYVNTARDYVIHHNIFDRSAYRMLHLVALKKEYCPQMHDNTYIQHLGGKIGQFGGNEKAEPENLTFDEHAEEKLQTVFGEKGAKVYYI